MNSIRTYSNLLKTFIFAHPFLLEDYAQGAPRKELVVTIFIEQFKIATLGKPYWWIPLVFRAICLTISFWSIFL